MKKRFFVLFFLFIALSGYVFSHGGEENYGLDHSDLYPLTQWEAVTYGSIAFGALILIILLFNKKMDNMFKKIFYFAIVLVAGATTVYLIFTTLHLNITSITKGPVHWHADFEIWACDKKINLYSPEGLSNKQGVDMVHAHNDDRVHVEGVLTDMKSASLGAFFYAIGGSLSQDGMKVPTDDGIVSVHDGDLCNGQAGKLYVFVNGNLIQDYPSYTISQYEKVPPGDRIKFIFTEKQIEEINPFIE